MAGVSPLNSACNCCEPPQEGLINLQFVSKSQSCRPSTCGFTPCASSGDTICSPDAGSLSQQEKCAPKRYLTRTINGKDGRTQTTTCTATQQGGCNCKTTCSGSQTTTTKSKGSYTTNGKVGAPPYSTFTKTCSTQTESKTVVTYNSDCSTSSKLDCSGTSSESTTYDTYLSGGPWSGIRIFSTQCKSTLDKNCVGWTGTFTQKGYNSNIDYSTGKVIGDFTRTFNISTPCCGTTESSTEVTPNKDKTNIEFSGINSIQICTPQSLPSFPQFTECGKTPPSFSAGQGSSGEAYKFVSPSDPSETSEQQFQFRVMHEPTATCYLKVWLEKEVQRYKNSSDVCPQLEEDGEPQKEDFGAPYEWKASGYPCFKNKEKPTSDCENLIYSQPQTVTAPQNQSITIKIKKWSYIKDYEPNDPDKNGCQGCKPNGFPIANPADCETCQ